MPEFLPGHLDVGDGHRIWVNSWGNPDGIPILFLHGGPGSGCNPSQAALFDATRHNVIFVDQRGAGQSLPQRERRHNTTAHLINDLELVRAHLGIKRWFLVGGSWGATLALAYAQAHPDRVRGIVLRATFLGTRAELDWAFGTGLATFHPALHAAVRVLVPDAQDVLGALWDMILHPDPEIHLPAAWTWYHVERALSELHPPFAQLPPFGDMTMPPATPFMEAHYFRNNCFMRDGALLAGAARLAGIPGIIVQARYDLLCPPVTAARLAGQWPDADLIIVEAAGHTLGHPGVFAAVRDGIARLTLDNARS
jgi:proline iminopeptidase